MLSANAFISENFKQFSFAKEKGLKQDWRLVHWNVIIVPICTSMNLRLTK